MTSPMDLDALRVLLDDHAHAAAEVARLSHPDDRGSGERTARLASLGAWEMRQASLVAQIEAITGRDVRASQALLDDAAGGTPEG